MKAIVPSQGLSTRQKKAAAPLIKAEVLKYQDRFFLEDTSAVLWTLHTVYGFGPKKLKDFWECWFNFHKEVVDRYEVSDEDTGWYFKQKLQDYGVDIEKWYKEKEES